MAITRNVNSGYLAALIANRGRSRGRRGEINRDGRRRRASGAAIGENRSLGSSQPPPIAARNNAARRCACLYGRFNASGNLQPAIVKPGDAFIRGGFICLRRAPKPRGEKGLLSNKKDERELCMDRHASPAPRSIRNPLGRPPIPARGFVGIQPNGIPTLPRNFDPPIPGLPFFHFLSFSLSAPC